MYNSKQLGDLSDRNLLAAARAYEVYLTASAASLNLGEPEETEIKNANNAFEATLDQWDAVQLEEAGSLEAKNDARTEVLQKLRSQRKVIYADESVSDSDLAAAGMPPLDTVKTESPAPSSEPIGFIDYGKLKHIINFRDSESPDKRAKPAGMQGCEIWHYIGTAPPTSEADYQYLATDTNSPYVVYYEMSEANKKAYYLLRWLSKSGERGEWSETIEATING